MLVLAVDDHRGRRERSTNSKCSSPHEDGSSPLATQRQEAGAPRRRGQDAGNPSRAQPLGRAVAQAREQRVGPLETRQPKRARPASDVDPPLLVHHGEERAVFVHRLRRAEKQRALGPQREVKDFQRAGLRVAVEVDEQVAAGDEVQPGEGRVLEQIVQGEKHVSRTSRLTR